MIIEWDDRYKLGVPAMDADHKALAECLNLFLSRAAEGSSGSELAGLMNDLVRKTHDHFVREEVLLDRIDYPYLARHRTEHDRLLSLMRNYQVGLEKGGTPVVNVTDETVEFLSNWLLQHIEEEDRHYKPYVARLS